MSAVVADTQSAVWYILNSAKLSSAALTALDDATQAGDLIYIASISVVEVTYLVEKGRLEQAVLDQLVKHLLDPKVNFEIVTLDIEIARALSRIQRDIVPEMPDRIIAATALQMGLPLVTSDHKIQAASNVQTIW